MISLVDNHKLREMLFFLQRKLWPQRSYTNFFKNLDFRQVIAKALYKIHPIFCTSLHFFSPLCYPNDIVGI